MKILFLSTLLFGLAIFNKSKAQIAINTKVDTSLQLLSYGLQRPVHQKARMIVAERYGFSYKTIAGCVVTKELVDNANRRNAAVREKLAALYGNDFWSKFEKEVKEELLRQQKVE